MNAMPSTAAAYHRLADHYRDLADKVTLPGLREGYAQLAASHEAVATELEAAADTLLRPTVRQSSGYATTGAR